MVTGWNYFSSKIINCVLNLKFEILYVAGGASDKVTFLVSFYQSRMCDP